VTGVLLLHTAVLYVLICHWHKFLENKLLMIKEGMMCKKSGANNNYLYEEFRDIFTSIRLDVSRRTT
jgi:hypothetical protein